MILLGDCMDVIRTLDTESFDTVLADPPYGISYELKGIGRPLQANYNDGRPTSVANDEAPFIWWLYDAFRVLKPGGALLCFCRWDTQEDFKQAIRIARFRMRSQVIWDRELYGVGDLKGQFAPSHDVVWFAVKGRKFAFPDKRPRSVIRCQRLLKTTHPNEKPVPLLRELVRAVTPKGGRVLEPFVGSGAGAEACAGEFDYTGIDIEPTWVRIASEREARAKGDLLAA